MSLSAAEIKTIAEQGMRPRSDARTLLVIAVVLFAVSCVVRIFLANYPKGIGVLPDEIRYLNLASSLLNDGSLIQRGGMSSFQKILYPLSIIPAYFFNDPQTRANVVTVLSCIYVSSALFPAYLLARRVFGFARTPIIACLLFTLICPDMCYSMTFLSESVYLPLALWLIACCLVAFEQSGKRQLMWSTLAGLLCYMAYLAKEVALGFALAFLCMMIVRIVKDASRRKSDALVLACFIAGLAIPFVLLKLTLFSGLLNSYNQTDPSVLTNPYTVLFTFYALAMDSLHFSVAFAFFPLVLPALTYARLTRRERELYLFSVLSFVFILLAVVYTISIREDVGHVGIRPHVRYAAPIFLPLLFLFIKQLLRRDAVYLRRNPLSLAAICTLTFMTCVFVLFMLGSGDYAQGFDNTQMHLFRLANEIGTPLPVDPSYDVSGSSNPNDIYHGSWLEINPFVWLARVLTCGFLILGLFALLSRWRFEAGTVVLACIAVFMLANNYGAWQYNTSVYKVEQENVSQVCEVEKFIDALPQDEQVLIVYDDSSSSINNLMDVYIDNNRKNCCYILREDFKHVVLEEGGGQKTLLLASDATMGDNIFGVNGRTCNDALGIDYVIVHSGQALNLGTGQAAEVTLSGVSDYRIYAIEDGAAIKLI